MKRRDFIRLVGGGIVLAAAASQARAQAGEPNAPWFSASAEESDWRKQALAYAILAPNPHNRQPWLVDLRASGEVILTCDPERLLPETDPFSRQIIIALGAFIETFAIAASAGGRKVAIQLFPEGYPNDQIDQRPVARITAAGTAERDPLFAHVLNRRSVKTPYDLARPIPDTAQAAVATAFTLPGVKARLETDTNRMESIRGFMMRAGQIEAYTARTWGESVRLMRIGRVENLRTPDGISMMGPPIERMLAAGQISREAISDPKGPAFQIGVERYVTSINATPAAHWIETADNTRESQINAGRAYMRVALTAVAHGLAMHPISQMLQEFPEMRDEYAAFHQYLGVSGAARVQMLARIGYGPQVPPSPRWAAETRIVPR